MNIDLSNRTIVVTGASRGLGKSFAEYLAAHGASLGLIARDKTALDNVAANLPTNSLAIECDITNEKQVAEVLDKICDKLGGIDSVVANAGALLGPYLASEIPIEKWRIVLELNLTGAFITAQSAYRHLRQSQTGRMVFISSCAAKYPTPGMCDYAAAKAGIEGLMRALCIEWAKDKICVNSIAPGFIDSGGTRDVDDNNRSRMISRTPLREPGNTSDLLDTLLLLVGDGSRYITGQVFSVDGGYGLT